MKNDGYEKYGDLWLPNSRPSEATTDKVIGDELYAVRGTTIETYRTGATVDPYRSNYTIYRAINLLATNVAQVPLLITKSGDQVPETDKQYDIFMKPNDWTSRFELWEQTMIYFYVYGEAFWYINRNEYGVPKDFYVLHPKHMKHHISEETGQIDGWIFNNDVPMTADEVIYYKLFNTTGLRGLSPLDSMLLEYTADTAAAEFNQIYFKNFSQIGGYIKADVNSRCTTDQMRDVIEVWNQKHQGAANAHKVAGLSPGLTYEDTGRTQRDMEYAEGRRDIRDRIMVGLGVNKTAMGISDDVNRANSKAAMAQIWQLTLKPQLIRIQEKLNAEYFMVFANDYRCRFDYASIDELKTDYNDSLDSAEKLIKIGYTRNEVNEALSLGMPEDTEFGDMRFVSNSLTPIEVFEDEPETKVVEGVVEKVETKSPGRYRIKYIGLHRRQDTKFAKYLKRYFYQQRAAVLKLLGSKKITPEEQAVVNLLMAMFVEQDEKLQAGVAPIYTDTSEKATKLAYTELGVTEAATAVPGLVKPAAQALTKVNKTIKAQILKQIHQGVSLGESVQQLDKRIKRVYNFVGTRIRTISRTESGKMVNATTQERFVEKGVGKHQWIGGQRESHAAQDGEIVIIGRSFANGLLYPLDPSGPPEEVINCTCCAAPIL